MLDYGSSFRAAGIRIRGGDQLPWNYSNSSKNRKTRFPSLCRATDIYNVPPRFRGKRETPQAPALRISSSAWTLVGPEVHLDKNAEIRPNPPNQDTRGATQGVDKRRPQAATAQRNPPPPTRKVRSKLLLFALRIQERGDGSQTVGRILLFLGTNVCKVVPRQTYRPSIGTTK